MEVIISYSLRENIYKILFNCIEIAYNKMKNNIQPKPNNPNNPNNTNTNNTNNMVSDVHVNIVAPHQAVDMVTNLWKRAKPSNYDDQASAPQPRLPRKLDSNASIWNCININMDVNVDELEDVKINNSVVEIQSESETESETQS